MNIVFVCLVSTALRRTTTLALEDQTSTFQPLISFQGGLNEGRVASLRAGFNQGWGWLLSGFTEVEVDLFRVN